MTSAQQVYTVEITLQLLDKMKNFVESQPVLLVLVLNIFFGGGRGWWRTFYLLRKRERWAVRNSYIVSMFFFCLYDFNGLHRCLLVVICSWLITGWRYLTVLQIGTHLFFSLGENETHVMPNYRHVCREMKKLTAHPKGRNSFPSCQYHTVIQFLSFGSYITSKSYLDHSQESSFLRVATTSEALCVSFNRHYKILPSLFGNCL